MSEYIEVQFRRRPRYQAPSPTPRWARRARGTRSDRPPCRHFLPAIQRHQPLPDAPHPADQGLANDDKRPFYAEGKPKAPIHKELVRAISLEERQHFSADRLLSFRGEGSPSLQAVVAVPPDGFTFAHAEFDLDLGNPLQDVVGIVVHIGELLDGKPTNHLDLWKKLAKGRAREYLCYRVLAQN